METNSTPWPENPTGYQVALEEMKLALQHNLASFDAVKNMARALFGSASLIIGLLGTLQIIVAKVEPAYRASYNILIVLTMLAYVVLILCCLLVLTPNNIYLPIAPEWDELWNQFISETDENIQKTRLSSYINAIQLNRPILARLRKITSLATLMLPSIILLVLIISILPRTP